MIQGIEISNNNLIVNLGLAQTAGVSRVMIKVSEGTNFHDDYARSNIEQARDLGMSVGGYHFARPSLNTGYAEAQFYQAQKKTAGLTQFDVLDLEDDDVAPNADLGAYVIDWLEAIGVMTGRVPYLYTSRGYAIAHKLVDLAGLAGYKLHIAQWQAAEPASISPFLAWSGWQYVGDGFVPGVGVCSQSLWQAWSYYGDEAWA